jgi:hypothetical protein
MEQSMDMETIQRDLENLPVAGLRAKFIEVMGYSSQSRNRPFLIRKILWGVQAVEYGGLPAAVKEKALRMADVRDVTTAIPGKIAHSKSLDARKTRHRFSPTEDSRLPLVGCVLTRNYKGREIRVLVGKDGFEFAGRRYRSLSAIAREVTGTSYNGFLFFKLK